MKRIMFGVVMAGWLAGWVTTIFNYLIFHASPWQNFFLFEDTLIKDFKPLRWQLREVCRG